VRKCKFGRIKNWVVGQKWTDYFQTRDTKKWDLTFPGKNVRSFERFANSKNGIVDEEETSA
jgi:hypothetical protein